MRTDLGHARAVQDNHPQCQQGGDAGSQDGDGHFHLPIFAPDAGPRLPGVSGCRYRPGGAVGVESGGLVGVGSGGVGTAIVADAFAGIFSFCPTLMLSVFKPFAARSALRVVPKCTAILVRLSPDFTVDRKSTRLNS